MTRKRLTALFEEARQRGWRVGLLTQPEGWNGWTYQAFAVPGGSRYWVEDWNVTRWRAFGKTPDEALIHLLEAIASVSAAS